MGSRVRRRWALPLLLVLHSSAALGHGGAPLTTRAQRQDGRLYLPTQYWSIFVGSDGGPWRWICDEAINDFALREVYSGLDGTLYATAFPGLHLSRDGGCTFTAVGGPVSRLLINGLWADPTPGPRSRRVWLTGTGEGIAGALYRSDDAGQSFTAVHPLDPAQDPTPHLARGLALAGDGRLHVLVDEGAQQDQPVLYTTRDGGQRFATTALTPLPAGVAPGRSRIVGVDARDDAVVYVTLQGDSDHVLLRVDTAGGTTREILRVQAYIFDVKVDRASDRLLVATVQGLYYADGGAAWQRSSGLRQAQCLDLQGDALYACAWEYGLDRMSLGRSRDGGATFEPVFRYTDTSGVLSCPSGTPVAERCPAAFAAYAPQLGIDVSAPRNPAPAPEMAVATGCQVGRGGGGLSGALLACAALGLGLLGLRRRVWRARRASSGR